VHEYVIATTGCGIIRYKDTKHTDKCSNNKTKNNTETKRKNYRQILFQDAVKVTQKNVTMYSHIIQGPYNKRYKKIFRTCHESFLNIRNSATE